MSNLPVVAAIPNYNMASSLRSLLPQLLRQGYTKIYVLDDASTDNSRQVVADFALQVTWVGGEENLGSGGNRNRILEAHPASCIIHFIDADTRFETEGAAVKAQLVMNRPNVAFVGGLVKQAHGRQHIWNYGPLDCLYSKLGAYIQYFFGNMQNTRPLWRKLVRQMTRPFLNDWPDTAIAPRPRAIFWVVEANMLVTRDTLQQLGGFDATIREHDIFPLAYAAYQAGLVTYFDPSIAVTHLAVQVRSYNRAVALRRAAWYLVRKRGFKNWLLPGGHFKPDYNK